MYNLNSLLIPLKDIISHFRIKQKHQIRCTGLQLFVKTFVVVFNKFLHNIGIINIIEHF